MDNLTIEDLSFAYDGTERLILQGINATVKSGEFVCLLGQSGCGKSTLLRLLAGLETPTSGGIAIDGEKITGASLDRGVVFQDYGLFPWMNAGDNILLALKQKFPKEDKKKLQQVASKEVEKVGLKQDVLKKLPKELSGGMKQRCAIARAFAINPPILLMDEPFGALDAVTRAKLQELVLDLWEHDEERKTVFFVTHDVDEALLLATRIFVLGQSPSNIIYEAKIDPSERPTRETLYENTEILKLRNELIKQINSDVASHIDEE